MTHLCSFRVTHTKNRLATGQRTQISDFIHAEGVPVLFFSQGELPTYDQLRFCPAPRELHSDRFGGSFFVSKPGSFLASAEDLERELRSDLELEAAEQRENGLTSTTTEAPRGKSLGRHRR